MSSHLESPRKILDLGAGIAACACLTNAGIVAFMTARPARIAIEPGTSAGADPLELPRISAQDIALLSKDFALVLDKEGTVWSVALSDTTRVREVMRDMRSICARSAGDSTFSISEEGKVFVLSLGRGEVGARPVDVPGKTRAIHASDGATSIVAEGDEGGQLRFYAGSALDRGPTSRVVLPRQAAEFDQVRGGRVFSVVFKRNGTSLCVVTRDGERTDAKMIGLASALADVAVTDASIVVAMVDGSLTLFDMASIVAGNEGFVAPVHTVSLGGTGRPRVALATTIKGTTSIWVGMTTGEVMRASLVEGAAPIKAPKEEPAPARPTNSEVETLRKELEEIRNTVGTSAAELQSRTHERDQLQVALDAKVVELQSRSDELHNRNNERDQLQATLDAKAVELQSRTDELHNRTNERDQLQVALDAKAVELQSRTDELHNRTHERDQLQVALNAKALELQSRTDELHNRTNERDQLQVALNAKVVELQLRTEERDQLNSKAAAAETRASELEMRANELDTKLSKALEAHNAIRDELEQMKSDFLRQRNDFDASFGKQIEEALPERVVEGLNILTSVLGRRRH